MKKFYGVRPHGKIVFDGYFLELIPCDEKYALNIYETHTSLTNLCIFTCDKSNDESCYRDYINLKERDWLIETANNCFCWEPGEYSFDVTLEYDENSKFKKNFHFSVSESDSEKLKKNISVIADLPYNNVWNRQSLMSTIVVKLEI